MSKKIILIEPTKPLPARLKVAAYARVSMDSDALMHSLSAQISYYSKFIQSKPEWEYCGVYADYAKTGTSDNREEFRRLIADCRAGKLNLVLTKSISRFARNTVDLLKTVRELKDMNIGVFFEEQGINTLSADGELMMTILASYAQEESRSISENVKWRVQKKHEKGEIYAWGNTYGYDWDNGIITINEEKGEIVKQIFDMYVNERKSSTTICKELNGLNIPSPHNCKWQVSVVLDILKNVKYKGDLLLGKKYIEDHISHKQIKNKGERPMYFVQDGVPAIVDREIWEQAQKQIFNNNARNHPEKFIFRNKLFCGFCGEKYRPFPQCGYRCWGCGNKGRYSRINCKMPSVKEEILKELCCDVLGITTFDLQIFNANVSKIKSTDKFEFTFFMNDGREIVRKWKRRRG
jgi:DNA invertase Pin-like site-specific DNA recombinase